MGTTPTPPAVERSPCDQKPEFQNNLFFRIALRFVETGRRFGYAEDIAHAGVADSVARAEIAVGIVVESTPGDASALAVVGSELIVNARMPKNVFRHALYLVEALGGEHVPVELSIQI
jgi:hypothetical protein